MTEPIATRRIRGLLSGRWVILHTALQREVPQQVDCSNGPPESNVVN
jgi:hypothetical protein